MTQTVQRSGAQIPQVKGQGVTDDVDHFGGFFVTGGLGLQHHVVVGGYHSTVGFGAEGFGDDPGEFLILYVDGQYKQVKIVPGGAGVIGLGVVQLGIGQDPEVGFHVTQGGDVVEEDGIEQCLTVGEHVVVGGQIAVFAKRIGRVGIVIQSYHTAQNIHGLFGHHGDFQPAVIGMGHQIHLTADLEGVNTGRPVGNQAVGVVLIPCAVPVGVVGHSRREFRQLIHGPLAFSGEAVQVFDAVVQRYLLVEQEAEHVVPQRQRVVPGQQKQLAVYGQGFRYPFTPPGAGKVNVRYFVPVQQDVLGNDFRYSGCIPGHQIVCPVPGHDRGFQILIPGFGGRTPFTGRCYIGHGDVVGFHDLGIPGVQGVVHRFAGHIFGHKLVEILFSGQQMEVPSPEILIRQVIVNLFPGGFSHNSFGFGSGIFSGGIGCGFGSSVSAGNQAGGSHQRSQQQGKQLLGVHVVSPYN